jgi:predicted dehydrogenase
MSTTSTYRVAVIGAGGIAKYSHVPGFQRLPNCEVVAICDVNEARARELADDLKVPRTYGDYNTMLAEVRPDITVVATPNVFHKTMSIAALEAGSNVLCEKPLALTYADAQEMFDIAAAHNRTLTAGTHYRFTPPMQAAKQQADAGFFGKIYAVRTAWQRRSGIPGYGSWFTNRDLAGGGALLDIGIHALDRALYIMGYPKPVSVSGASFAEFGPRGLGLGGWGSDIFMPAAGARYDVDDFTWAFIRFENDAVVNLQVSWASNYPEVFVTEVFGSEGGAHIGSRDNVELYTTLNKQDVSIKTPLHEAKVGSYFKLIENFVRALDGDTTADIPTREQALTSVQIIDAVTRSAASGREVVL